MSVDETPEQLRAQIAVLRRSQRAQINLMRDLAEVRDQLAHANQELERSNTELEQFAYVASHDLQEPLRMVTAFGALLEEHLGEQLDQTGRDYLHYITDGGRRMQVLIRDLLAFSRVGRGESRVGPVALEPLVASVLHDLRERIWESEARVTVGQLPEVRADGTMLTLAVQNLITNALKYCGARPPVIEISARAEKAVTELVVRDHGIGIAPEHHGRIFEPFRRLHSDTDFEGSGIGLAICRKVVERHGGQVWMEIPPEGGSHFRFTLPLAAADPPGDAIHR